jgi:hypothetical protein
VEEQRQGYIPVSKIVKAEAVAQVHLSEPAAAGENWGFRIDGVDLVVYANEVEVGRVENGVLFGPSCLTAPQESVDEQEHDDGPLWAHLLADADDCMLLDGHEVLKEMLGSKDAGDWFDPPGPGVWFWEGDLKSDGIDDVEFVGAYKMATVRNAIDGEGPVEPRGDHDRVPV